jgi:D-aspartate ligase
MDMAQQGRSPGALVLGSDFKALGVIRSLGRRGVPCILVDNLPRSAWFSRYVSERHAWQGPMDGAPFVDYLLQIGKQRGLTGWLVFPTQDEVVEMAARYNDQLGAFYRLATQGWEVVQWAVDKRLTDRMAQEVGVAYPKTWYPACEERLADLDITFPAIVKPAVSIRLQNTLRLKALPARNVAELRAQYRLALAAIQPDEIMIQEIIPGCGPDQYSVAAYCKDGEPLMHMTARRTRQYPIDYGLGSSFVEAQEVPGLYELACKVLRYMRVSGMVEVEFKHDRRDGLYKLLDINVRPWGWHTLCIACGLDFPYIEYCDMLGQEPVPVVPHYSHRWMRVLTDLPAGLQEMRAGITTPTRYVRSLFGRTTFSVHDWRDPLPTLGDAIVAISRVMHGLNRHTASTDDRAPAEATAAASATSSVAGQ